MADTKAAADIGLFIGKTPRYEGSAFFFNKGIILFSNGIIEKMGINLFYQKRGESNFNLYAHSRRGRYGYNTPGLDRS